MSFIWTTDNLALAMQYRASTVPAAEIARLIGTTKNSVVGKLYREGYRTTKEQRSHLNSRAQRRVRA